MPLPRSCGSCRGSAGSPAASASPACGPWRAGCTRGSRAGAAVWCGATRSTSFGCEEGERLCRSEEHTSELQSRLHLVCRLLLEKKKKINKARIRRTHTGDFNEKFVIRVHPQLVSLSLVSTKLTYQLHQQEDNTDQRSTYIKHVI